MVTRYAALMLAIGLIAIAFAACTENGESADDVDLDNRETVEMSSADHQDDQTTGTPPPYEVSEAESDDGQRAVLISYGQKPTDYMAAEMIGELALSGECLGVWNPADGGFVPIVWLHGFSLDFDDGDAVLLDENGEIIAHEGERVTMGGGSSDPNAHDKIAEVAPEDCVFDAYWMSGIEVRRMPAQEEPEPAIHNGKTVYFPQWEEVRNESRVAMHGRLFVQDECIYLSQDHDRPDKLLIWPPDYSVEIDEQDRVVVRDQDGGIAAREGDYTSSFSVERGTFDREQYGIPDHCEGDHAMVFDPDGLYYPDDDERADRGDAADELQPEAQQYAEAFDVSEEEATRRLDLQGRIGPAQQNIMVNESHRFGGMFWEHEPEYRMVVLLTEGDEDDILDYFYDDEIKQIVEVRIVELTLEELHEIQHEATELLRSLDLEISSSTSVQNNHVVIYAEDISLVEATLAEASLELPEHVVLEEEELDQPEEDS